MAQPAYIVRAQRAITSVLQPLTGDRATGRATVKATGDPVLLPANSYAVPAPEGSGGGRELDYTKLLKVTGNPKLKGKPQPVEVTSAGTSVEVFSAVGGLGMNLGPNTPIRWDPPIAGVELVSVLDGDGLSGATAPPEDLERVEQIAIFEGVGARPPVDFFRAGVGVLPALVLSWDRASNRRKAGVGKTTREHHFRIYVGVDRLDNHNTRRDQGLTLLDALADLLLDRSSVDGEVFSVPPIDGGEATRGFNLPGVYIYVFDFFTTWTTLRRDTRTKTPWLRTRIQGQTSPSEEHPQGDEKVLADVETRMEEDPEDE